MPRVPMRGEVIEVKNLEEVVKLSKEQLIGAKLVVFSPEIDNVGNVQEKFEGDDVMNVQICYKKVTSIIKVSLTRMVTTLADDGNLTKSIQI
ncbi:unnamed protein product [Eruca vesicaria subsp. sativa]|uniref:Uncharacterized protein n=1 Tax=Eruca vesicaria subsp. sativa TaxID=29727 RepID=A0ABC8JG65_ERUVS|nr:unnamed protein product [Eruca vesicaria subsp. sativa]